MAELEKAPRAVDKLQGFVLGSVQFLDTEIERLAKRRRFVLGICAKALGGKLGK